MRQKTPAKMRFFLHGAVVSFSTLYMLSVFTKGEARTITVGSGISAGYEWYERKYDNDAGAEETDAAGVVTLTEDLTELLDDNYSRLRITPQINIESLSARDEIRIQYSPSFRYDIDSEENDIDHKLTASVGRHLTQQWKLSLEEKFVLSDIIEENTTGETADSELSDENGRRQYVTNNLSIESLYQYWEDSFFTARYSYSILENTDDEGDRDYENYDRHTFFLGLSHRFDSQWNYLIDVSYVRGLYEEVEEVTDEGEDDVENDLEEFRISTTLEAHLIENHPLSLAYHFYGIDYDQVDRRSNNINDFTVGWRWNYSQYFSLSIGGGPSYIKTDGQKGEWGYNGNLGLEYKFENGSLRVSGLSGYERENFSGTDENGLQEFWQARIDFFYRPLQDVSLNLYSSFRDEDQERITGAVFSGDEDAEPDYETTIYNTETSRVGGSINYLFQRWYTLSLSYNYTHQESERLNDSYADHRFMFTLSFKRDLYKW